MKKTDRDITLLGLFIVLLFCFLIITAALVSSQQREILRKKTIHDVASALDLMADAAREALRKNDTSSIRNFVDEWGRNRTEYHELRIVAPDGAVIATYQRAEKPVRPTFSLTRKVILGDSLLATIYLTGDYCEDERIIDGLSIQLLITAVLLITLLGAALWFLFRHAAIGPLEEEVYKRTQALSISNQELEQEMAERRRAEDALKEREAHISLILNSIAEGIYGTDLEGNCTFLNPAACRLLGYSRAEDVIGKNIHALIHHTRPDGTEYQASDCKVYFSCRQGKGVHADDEIFWRPDRSSFPVEYWAQPIIREGVSIGAVTAFTDISERKNAEASIFAANDRLRLLYTQSPLAIIEWNLDFKVALWNPTAERIFGFSAAEALDRHASFIFPDAERSQATDTWAALVRNTSGGVNRTCENVRKDGRVIVCEWHNTPLIDKEGVVVGASSFVQDVTEKQKLEDHLRQSQKMDSVGTLAGGIAHDFNNILTAIIGYGNIALLKMGPHDPQRSNIEHILTSANRATYLTQGLLAFSRKRMSNKKTVDLNVFVKNTENFLSRIIGEDIQFITNLHANPLLVSADQNQIEQAIMNLATNARDAMPKGGILTVAIDNVRLDDEFSKQHGFGKPGRYGMITVADTGIGISEEIQKRMFEPFFTTKEAGKGTGLGLAIIYGIVKQHNGFITVDSMPGKGTTFRMYLPIIEAECAATIKPGKTVHPSQGTETILLAEDEETLRELMRSVFVNYGYTVIVAVDGADAVEKFAENKDRIHLFLSDIIMPKMNGKEAFDEIRKMRPDIKVIFASGYSPDIVKHKADLGSETTIIYKPISPMDLLKNVRNVLDAQ